MPGQTTNGNPLPNPFKWTVDYETFYTMIDVEHRVLFDSIALMEKKPDSEMALRFCQEQVRDHFAAEEAKMLRNKYEGYVEHKKKHEAFLGTLDAFQLPVNPESIDFAKNWLCDHIMEHDFNYKKQLNVF